MSLYNITTVSLCTFSFAPIFPVCPSPEAVRWRGSQSAEEWYSLRNQPDYFYQFVWKHWEPEGLCSGCKQGYAPYTDHNNADVMETVHMKWEPYMFCVKSVLLCYLLAGVWEEWCGRVHSHSMSSHTIINTGNLETLVSAATTAQAINSECGCSYPTSIMCLLPHHTQGVCDRIRSCECTQLAGPPCYLLQVQTIYFQQRPQFLQWQVCVLPGVNWNESRKCLQGTIGPELVSPYL